MERSYGGICRLRQQCGSVRKKGVSINKAAVLHGVPKTTLLDHLNGWVVHGTKPGPCHYLEEEEKLAVADHLVEAVKAGYEKDMKTSDSYCGKGCKG